MAGISSFAVAVEIAVKDQPEFATRVGALRDELVARVRAAVPDAVLNGDPHDRLPGNAHFSFPGCEGDALLLLLDAAGIACSTGSACSAGIAQPSHVLVAMGADDAGATVDPAVHPRPHLDRRTMCGAGRRAAGGGGAGPPGGRAPVGRRPLAATLDRWV